MWSLLGQRESENINNNQPLTDKKYLIDGYLGLGQSKNDLSH